MKAMKTLEALRPSEKSSYDVVSLEEKCYLAMDDDFNTPILIAHLFDGVKAINLVKGGKERLSSRDLKKIKSIFYVFVTKILGLISKKENNNDLTNELMELILKLRKNAKSNKDFTTADLIREELNKINIEIKDTRKESTWELND